MSWQIVVLVLGALLVAKLVAAWRSSRPHLFDSWEGFDLFVRSLVLERKDGAALTVRHRDSSRAVIVKKLPGGKDHLSFNISVPDSTSARSCADRRSSETSDVSSTADVSAAGVVFAAEISGVGEPLVVQTVNLMHRLFQAMGLGPGDHFKATITGEYAPEYFRDASEKFLNHEHGAVRAAARLTNLLAKRHLRKREAVAKRDRKRE